ncbi:MAG TPA: hypothetical protein VE077_10965 [Candidatus Methylomirabilis sp.]|nr:hypothetical protein [Candidatus Methylomirabilis sp.]
MARYSAFLGLRVEVQYRAGDILLPASGTFVADSGRSIFLEQQSELKGQHRHFRWEIPYQYIVRLVEAPDSGRASADPVLAGRAGASSQDSSPAANSGPADDAANSAKSPGGAPGILPLQNRPKTA